MGLKSLGILGLRTLGWAAIGATTFLLSEGQARADDASARAEDPFAEPEPSAAKPKRLDKPSADEWVLLYLTSIGYGGMFGMFLDGLSQTSPYASFSFLTLLEVPIGAGVGAATVAVVNALAPFKWGVPQTVTSSMLIGLGEGIALNEWSSNRATTSFHTYQKDTAWIFGSTTVGLATGIVLAATVKTTPGRAAWVATTGLFGGLFAGSIAGAASPTSSFPPTASGLNAEGNRNVGITAAIGGAAGVATGLATATLLSPSNLRVHLIDLAWIGGSALAGGVCADTGCKAPAVFGAMAIGGGLAFAGAFLATMGMRKQGLTDGHPTPGMVPYVSPTAGGVQFGLGGSL